MQWQCKAILEMSQTKEQTLQCFFKMNQSKLNTTISDTENTTQYSTGADRIQGCIKLQVP